MDWRDYLNSLISSNTDISHLTVSVNGGDTVTEIPPIIRASIAMLDKMVSQQGNFNLFVFPERSQTFLLFTLIDLFHSIVSGEVRSNYDPADFTPGEKIKMGNAVVEFLGTEVIDGKNHIVLKLADLERYSAPASQFPVFQKVSTNRRLSTSSQFKAEKKKLSMRMYSEAREGEELAQVESMKTHITSSIFAVTTLAWIREQISVCQINGINVSNIFFMGQSDYKGDIQTVGKGQMSGIPSVVFASDLYSVRTVIEKDHPIHSIFIDISNPKIFSDQMDVLDQLMELNIPIICVTDTANSFDLKPLEDRRFNIWRWSSESLTDAIRVYPSLTSEIAVNNCTQHSEEYIKTNGCEISEAMKILSSNKKKVDSQSARVSQLYEEFSSLIFFAMRTLVPFSAAEMERAQDTLKECEHLLAEERTWIDKEAEADYTNIIELLRVVFSENYCLKKIKALKDYLREKMFPEILLVVPHDRDREKTEQYWKFWCKGGHVDTNIYVVSVSEYARMKADPGNVTIVCGWLGRSNMQKILFSYHTACYTVLLYDCEELWKDQSNRAWKKKLSSTSNREITEHYFSTETAVSMPGSDTSGGKGPAVMEPDDELEEIELILRENKYRKYASTEERTGDDNVTATPVNFVGGYLTLYRKGHSVITATSIILQERDQIENKFPDKLEIGDFVVVRESSRDLIRDLANIILKNSGKENLREMAGKWKEAISIELLFSTESEFYLKLLKAGCDKEIATVRNWIEDDDVIAPRSKKDLQFIADATENEMLQECIDEVYDAASEVRNAHVLAGKKLSEQLKKVLADELKKYGEIDPFNFWEPITFDIEGIGKVEVLKIIDIGADIQTNVANTNKLISEWSDINGHHDS